MKRVKNLIKLTSRKSERLNQNELNHSIAGNEPPKCQCMCYYATCGGSSDADNRIENGKWGFVSMLPKNQKHWG